MSHLRTLIVCLLVVLPVAGCDLPQPEVIHTEGDGGIIGSGTVADPVRLSDKMPSGTYIQNLAVSAPPQNASFNIAGSGVLRGNLGVGIGTTSPGARLEVSGGDQVPIKIDGSNGSNFIEFYNPNVKGRLGYVGFGSLQTSLMQIYTDQQDGPLAIATGGPTPIMFYTQGQERMRVDGNGNVGIGTTSPVEKLEVTNGPGGSAAVKVFSTGNGHQQRDNFVAVNQGTLPGASAAYLFKLVDDKGNEYDAGRIEVGKEEDWKMADAATRKAFFNFYTSNQGAIAPSPQMSISAAGVVGVGGTLRMAPRPAPPYKCTEAHDAEIAMTLGYKLCVCISKNAEWYYTDNPVMKCLWGQ